MAQRPDLMKRALQSFLNQCINSGNLTVELASGERLTAGDGTGLPLVVTLKDAKAVRELFFHPQMALGELFTDGRLLVSGGAIYDLLELLGKNLHSLTPPQFGQVRHVLRNVFDRWTRRNSSRVARDNV